MIQGHTFDSFTATNLRNGSPYMLSQFLGGMPPAIFLFLTGITFSFLMDSQERQQPSGWKRVIAALKRSRYLFILAILFRLQAYVFGFPTSPASELLRVDILNCMGFAMLLLAPMAVFSTRERIRLCTILGLVIACLAPLVSQIDASSGMPALIRAYFSPSFTGFGFFPWASFLAFGMAAGSAMRIIKQEDMSRLMLWMLAIGLGLIMCARAVGDLPYSLHPKTDFWLNSPILIFIKLGVVLTMLAVGYLWVNAGLETQKWSLFRQLGTTSLLVYWVHIELVYGRWFYFFKGNLGTGAVLLFTAALLALMVGLSLLQTRYQELGWIFRPPPLPAPRRASGD
jgi:fucose 4-O-acetylase-like acetyltransferase